MRYVDGELLGYIVVEYNQASRQPDLPVGATLLDDEQAFTELEYLEEENEKVGRGERYRVCAVVTVDESWDDETDEIPPAKRGRSMADVPVKDGLL